MQTTRTHNFSLFVTVLSACLGLLAVGTPAQVYAQQARRAAESAAPASEDRKCGDEISPDAQAFISRGAFFNPIKEFIADLRKLISIDKLKADYQHADISVDVSQTGGQRLTSANLDRWLRLPVETAAEKLAADFGEGVAFYRYDDEWKQNAAHFGVTIHLDASDFNVITTHDQNSFEQTQKLATAYNSYFFFGACRSENKFEKLFYTNTRALVDKNIILIVTHLPRADLDELLKEQPEAN